MPANEIVLYITLGFMLVCFAAWLWQSISKRRKLEDEIEEEKENNAAEKPISIDLARKASRYML